MVCDLLSGVLQTLQALGENSELLSWEKDVAKSTKQKGTINCGQKHLFHKEFFPQCYFFPPKKTLDFLNKESNALTIFTKGKYMFGIL